MARPLIVGVGGTTRDNSTSELALNAALARARALGAETLSFSGEALDLPHYGLGRESARVAKLVAALRRADGVILSSPGYHGAMSGMLKNALDYVEDLRDDERPYLDGRAVGIIVSAYGAQAIGTTLVGVRSVIHALRAWPTPMGVGINSLTPAFDRSGACTDPAIASSLSILAEQVVDFANLQKGRVNRIAACA